MLDKQLVSAYDRDWSIMLLLDCLHHEEADLMVGVGDLFEHFHSVDLTDQTDRQVRETALDAVPGVEGVMDGDTAEDDSGRESVTNEREISLPYEESLAAGGVFEDDLDRQYYGEKAAEEDVNEEEEES